jgi:hypothetical protein
LPVAISGAMPGDVRTLTIAAHDGVRLIPHSSRTASAFPAYAPAPVP